MSSFERSSVLFWTPYAKIIKRKLYSFGSTKNDDTILVGYLKPEYFDALFQKQRTDFLFYFYAKKEEIEYELHPEILNCTSFIGYSDNKEKVIVGIPDVTIRKASANELREALSEFNYTPTADYYYCIVITDVHFEPYAKYEQKFNKSEEINYNKYMRQQAPIVI